MNQKTKYQVITPSVNMDMYCMRMNAPRRGSSVLSLGKKITTMF